MKRISKFILVALFGAITVGAFAGCSDRLNEIGSDKYYVQITKDGDRQYEGKYNGKDVYDYYYKDIKAYNKNGDEIKVKFSAEKNLRKNAFLKVKVKDLKKDENNDILSYEEVQRDDLPDKVKEKLNVK